MLILFKRLGMSCLMGLLVFGKPFFAFAQERPKVALVLSGGGARGAAHIGVLRALNKAGVPIDMIVGASYGALVGGLYAVGYSADDVARIVTAIDWGEITDDRPDRRLLNTTHKRGQDRSLIAVHLEDFTPQLPQGIFSGQKIQQVLDLLTTPATYRAENDFDRLPIPFRTVATDILTGDTRVFKSGTVSLAIRASIAVPGLFTPVETENTLLVDGGIANNLPVDVALAEGADYVIAVDCATPLRTNKDEIGDFIDIFDQAISFRIEEKKIANRKLAHALIMPDLKDYKIGDFDAAYDLIALGEQAAEEHLDAILDGLNHLSVATSTEGVRSSLLPELFDLKVWSGLPLDVVVHNIRFEGVQPSDAAGLRKQLQTPLDEPVALHMVDQDVSRLYATGLFETISYALHREGDQTTLVFTVREVSQSELGFGLHYDQDFQLLALSEFWQRHVIGRGSDFFVRGVLGKLKFVEAGVYARPAPLVSVRLMAQLHWHSQGRLAFQGETRLGDFEESRYQATVGIQSLFGNWGSAQLGYQFERLHVRKGAPLFADVSENVPNVWFDWTLDTRNKPFLPDQGLFMRLRAKRVFAMPDYYHLFGTLSQFVRVRDNWTVGLNGTWGYVSAAAPAYDHLYVGGAEHFGVAAVAFPGVSRDALRVTRMASGGISVRKRFRDPSVEALRDLAVGAFYRAGIFNRAPSLVGVDEWIHGLGVGMYLDRRFPGPMRLEVTGSNRNTLLIYGAVGYAF
ncbi:MAG: BamA/TamA family outer membrane protein [Candidatus Latescibacteria bacterium]|nr:BamA/TamA family outer membrane protein [Candidatus Latescibacterota bacterium]